MTAVRIRAAVEALGGDSSRLLDERRCTAAIGDESVVDDIGDCDSDWDYEEE